MPKAQTKDPHAEAAEVAEKTTGTAVTGPSQADVSASEAFGEDLPPLEQLERDGNALLAKKEEERAEAARKAKEKKEMENLAEAFGQIGQGIMFVEIGKLAIEQGNEDLVKDLLALVPVIRENPQILLGGSGWEGFLDNYSRETVNVRSNSILSHLVNRSEKQSILDMKGKFIAIMTKAATFNIKSDILVDEMKKWFIAELSQLKPIHESFGGGLSSQDCPPRSSRRLATDSDLNQLEKDRNVVRHYQSEIKSALARIN